MLEHKFFVPTFVLLLQISHVLSEVSAAEITSSRHQVSIRRSADDEVKYGSGHFCSGILISNFTVLTSASCLLKTSDEFYNAAELKVAMGNLNRLEKDERLTFYTHVKAVKTHGRFNKKTYANNLAILELGAVEFSPTVIPVLTSNEKVSNGLNCYVLGWSSSSGEMTETLMQTNVKTRPRDVCNQNENFPFATFCSSEDGSNLDKCAGESGSGLICNGVLRGVVSKTCSDKTIQYTDVSQLFNWIWINHLDGSLGMIDNDLMKKVVFGALDLAAYFINTPKIADDLETVKFLF